MIIKLLLVVSFVLLGEQMVSTVNGDANSQCQTLNYKFSSDTNGCNILDDTSAFSSNNGSFFCTPPPMPELIPINEFPRMFKLGVPLDLNYDYRYCGNLYMSYSLQEYLKIRSPGYPNDVSDANLMYSWRNRALAAITYLKANLYIRAYPFGAGQWDPKGQFGPLFYRAKYGTSQEQIQAGKVIFQNILGFASYNQELKMAYFNFFLPDSMKDSDSTVMKWRQNEQYKTDFEIGVDLVSACKDGFSSQICDAPKTPMVTKYLESYIPLIVISTEATINSAILRQNWLELNLKWSVTELSQFTKQVVEGPENCRPKLTVVVYDSNPASPSRGDKNDKVRSVLTTFSHVLAWNASAMHVETAFNLYSDETEWARMRRETQFLKNINNWSDGEPDAMLFYKDWAKETGLKIAITTCMCRTSPLITDRNRGCRDYKHHPLSVDTYWVS